MTILIHMTIYITITALLILLFKKVFNNKLSARWHFIIWILLIIRLAFPILPESGLSVFNIVTLPDQNIFEAEAPVNLEITDDITVAEDSLTETIKAEDTAGISSSGSGAPHASGLSLNNIAVSIWGICALTLFSYFTIVYISQMRKIHNGLQYKDHESLSLFEECKRITGVKRNVMFLNSDCPPMLAGFLKPKILIPDIYDKNEKRYIMLHELSHLKHGDTLFIWIAVLILCLNWFNPVIWYSFFVFRNDIELYCDQRVLNYTSDRKGYAEVLLKTALPGNRFILGTTSLQNGRKDVKRRIKYMAEFKKPKMIITIVMIISVLLIGGCTLTNSGPDYLMSEERYNEYIHESIGSVMAELDYIDNEKAVFHYLSGLFVYDRIDDEMDIMIDLSKLNCSHNQQGSNIIEINVSSDGDEALITSYGPEEEIRDFDNYIIDLKTGKTEITDMKKLTDAIADTGCFSDTASAVPDADGWSSFRCIKNDGKIYYMSNDYLPYIYGIKLIEADNNGNKKDSVPVFAKDTVALITKDTISYKDADMEKKSRKLSKNDIVFIISRTDKGFFTVLPSLEPEMEFAYIKSDDVSFEKELLSNANYGFIKNSSIYNDKKGVRLYSNEGNGRIYINKRENGFANITISGGIDNKWVKGSDISYDFNPSIYYGKTPLYAETSEYMINGFKRVYDPYYEILSISITDWQEKDNEAVFNFKVTTNNYYINADTLEYIKGSIESLDIINGACEIYDKDSYNPKENNFTFKVVLKDEKIELYKNISSGSTEWKKTSIDDFV